MQLDLPDDVMAALREEAQAASELDRDGRPEGQTAPVDIARQVLTLWASARRQPGSKLLARLKWQVSRACRTVEQELAQGRCPFKPGDPVRPSSLESEYIGRVESVFYTPEAPHWGVKVRYPGGATAYLFEQDGLVRPEEEELGAPSS